jgi:hypothetical protein
MLLSGQAGPYRTGPRQESLRRKELLQDYLCLTRGGGWGHYLPRAYENRHLDIVPLRFVFTHPEARKLTGKM